MLSTIFSNCRLLVGIHDPVVLAAVRRADLAAVLGLDDRPVVERVSRILAHEPPALFRLSLPTSSVWK